MPLPNGVLVATGPGYHRVEGDRWASRNGPVSDVSNSETLALRFETFSPRMRVGGTTGGEDGGDAQADDEGGDAVGEDEGEDEGDESTEKCEKEAEGAESSTRPTGRCDEWL